MESKTTAILFWGVFGVVAAIILGAVLLQEETKTASENAIFTFSQAVGKEAPDFILQSYGGKSYQQAKKTTAFSRG